MHAQVLTAVCILLATVTALTTRQSTTSTPLPASIPLGYKYQATTGSYYKYHGSWATWDGANTTCASEGAHLVVLNDALEADVVKGIVRKTRGAQLFTWSGLHDDRPGGVMEWRTVKGEALNEVYNEWDDGHPKNGAGWTCALYQASIKRLVDAPCDSDYHFVCEISQ